jgi:hypothetical protein
MRDSTEDFLPQFRYDSTQMRWLLFLVLCTSATAQTTDHLAAIRELLLPLRQPVPQWPKDGGEYGATPAFAPIKQHLREWVESKLNGLGPQSDPSPLAQKLNAELAANRFFRTDKSDDWSYRGYLGELRFEQKRGFLILHTRVGVLCGYDQSAYAYQYTPTGWDRVWQFELDNYGKEFKALNFNVEISRAVPKTNSHLFAIAGNPPWCSSCWSGLTAKAWRVAVGLPQKELLAFQDEKMFYRCADIHLAVEPNDLWLEYTVFSLDTFQRPEVRHYKFEQDRPERVDPLALSPRDFLHVWLLANWSEAGRWTENAHFQKLKEHHEKRDKKKHPSSVDEETTHCLAQPNVYQLGLSYGPEQKQKQEFYYLIRWRPPYRFTLVDVRSEPVADCLYPDPAADQQRSLFLGR